MRLKISIRTNRVFHAEQAAELVDVLARQISRQEKRVAFQQRMLQLLREL